MDQTDSQMTMPDLPKVDDAYKAQRIVDALGGFVGGIAFMLLVFLVLHAKG